MSFILDALKKIEEDKRRGEVQQAPDAMAIGRTGGATSRRVLVMIGIAFASAALTASLLMLGRGAEDAGSAELAEGAPAEESLVMNSVAPNDASASEPTGTTTLELAAPEPEASPATAPPKKAEAPRTTEVEVDTSPSPVASAPEPSETVDAPVETIEEESTAAFRLVGRESPRLYGNPNLDAPAEEETMSEPVAGEESLPDHFPKLVLQGTSVINGEPVAVINDQRVFEGDSVEGARVLGIEERVVELELEGVRFKIQL